MNKGKKDFVVYAATKSTNKANFSSA